MVDVAYLGDNDTDVGEQLPSHVSDDDGGTSQLLIIDRPRLQRRPNVMYSRAGHQNEILDFNLEPTFFPCKIIF